jgi:plastocyanin
MTLMSSFRLARPSHLVIERSGTINFYCRYHTGMKGQLEVRASQ